MPRLAPVADLVEAVRLGIPPVPWEHVSSGHHHLAYLAPGHVPLAPTTWTESHRPIVRPDQSQLDPRHRRPDAHPARGLALGLHRPQHLARLDTRDWLGLGAAVDHVDLAFDSIRQQARERRHDRGAAGEERSHGETLAIAGAPGREPL